MLASLGIDDAGCHTAELDDLIAAAERRPAEPRRPPSSIPPAALLLPRRTRASGTAPSSLSLWTSGERVD